MRCVFKECCAAAARACWFGLSLTIREWVRYPEMTLFLIIVGDFPEKLIYQPNIKVIKNYKKYRITNKKDFCQSISRRKRGYFKTYHTNDKISKSSINANFRFSVTSYVFSSMYDQIICPKLHIFHFIG